MQAIFEALGAVVNALLTIGSFGIWLFDGLIWMIGMMVKSVSMFGTVLNIFPAGVVSCITAVCGGLIVLRIFGRS